jgi:hypothetical protein
MRRIFSLGMTAFLGMSLFAGPATAANPLEYQIVDRPSYMLGIGFDYETGDYGTGNDSEFISVPFYLDIYPTDRFDIELVVPYLYQRTDQDGGTTIFYRSPSGYTGSTVRQSRRGQSRDMSASNDLADSSNGTIETVETAHSTSENGLGDISVTLGYALLEENLETPLVRPTFYLKFPTADEDKGLGSGEFDFGFGLSLGKWLDNWHLYTQGLYILQGNTSLYDSKDYLGYEVSIGRQIGASFFVSAMARGMTAPAAGGDDLLEGRLKGVWWIAPDISVEGYAGTGLSEQSAEFTSSIAVFFSF